LAVLPLAFDWTVVVTAGVVSAVIAAGSSLLVALISRRTDIDVAKINEDIENLKSELAQKSAAEDARRDYEYEARKRLYAECYPLLFQSLDLTQTARRRVVSLARTARSGAEPGPTPSGIRADGTGWLDHYGYYYLSTVYFLVAPLTSFRILQRRLTAIDLRLEAGLQGQYEALRLMFQGFEADFDLAELDHTKYEPDTADTGRPNWQELRRDEPAIYGRQGFYAGTLDTVVERLIATSQPQRCKSFGEFCAELNKNDQATLDFKNNVDEVFIGFHPKRKPILWRILVTEVALDEAFLELQSSPTNLAERLAEVAKRFASAGNVKTFDWRSSPQDATDEEVRKPLEIAAEYLRGKSDEMSVKSAQR
jgi:hypothetical protein